MHGLEIELTGSTGLLLTDQKGQQIELSTDDVRRLIAAFVPLKAAIERLSNPAATPVPTDEPVQTKVALDCLGEAIALTFEQQDGSSISYRLSLHMANTLQQDLNRAITDGLFSSDGVPQQKGEIGWRKYG